MSELPTLVLVHGCGHDARFWDEVVAHTGELRVLAPSLPGRASTPGPACKSAGEAARWLDETLAAERVGRAIVVGHSYGGGVAIELALLSDRDPSWELVGLGLISTGARLRVAPAILDLVKAAADRDTPVDLASYCYRPQTDRALIERTEAHARRTPAVTTMHDWHATNAFDRLADVAAIDVPTLVVNGADDILTPPKYGRFLGDRIAGARVEVVADAGHMLPVERGAMLAQLLVDFARALV